MDHSQKHQACYHLFSLLTHKRDVKQPHQCNCIFMETHHNVARPAATAGMAVPLVLQQSPAPALGLEAQPLGRVAGKMGAQLAAGCTSVGLG